MTPRSINIFLLEGETPSASLKGLRVNMSKEGAAPVEMPPPPSPHKYWTHKGIAE